MVKGLTWEKKEENPSPWLMSVQNLKTPQPKRIFVGTLCPVLFLTATTNQLDLIGPEWNGKKMGGGRNGLFFVWSKSR